MEVKVMSTNTKVLLSGLILSVFVGVLIADLMGSTIPAQAVEPIQTTPLATHPLYTVPTTAQPIPAMDPDAAAYAQAVELFGHMWFRSNVFVRKEYLGDNVSYEVGRVEMLGRKLVIGRGPNWERALEMAREQVSMGLVYPPL